MPEKKDVYHVAPNTKGGWDVQKEGNKRPSGYFTKKTDAVARGKELAKKAKLGQVTIHKQDGTVQAEYSYGG